MKKNTIVLCLSPYAGGMEMEAIEFAKKLNKKVRTILVVKENSFMHERVTLDKLEFKTINFKRMLSFSIIFALREIVKSNNIENIIFFGSSEMKSIYFSLLGLNINLIVRHSTTKSTPKKDWFHSLVYSKVNYHISTSKHLFKNVKYIFPFGKKSIDKYIYSSFDFSEPKYIEHEKLTLLHIGRIADAKGQIDAIKACKTLVDNNIDFKFYIVGGYDENYKAEFLKFYNSVPYQDKIEVLGFVDSVKEYIYKSDIFIFPSYGEGISISFREALANNLTCIAYDNTSFPEFKELGFDFYLCKDRDIEDLSNTLLEICKKDNFDNVKSNYNIVKKIFSEDEELKNYLNILR